MISCELCTENVNVHIVSKCNHNNICFLCIIKLRVKTGNQRCPFCNLLCDEIILTDKPDVNYEDLDHNSVIPYMNGLYFENEKVKAEVDEFNQIKCPIPKCNDTTVYHNITNLKKHLKEKHNRFFCDICLDHRTLVFKEQKLFTGSQLDRHMKKGDLDDEGNVIFFHPYCKYCDRFFYDEEVLIKHLREEHYRCDLCDEDRKFFFFNKYDNLEVHYNLSHYLCQDEICRKSHTAFKTAAELEHHTMKYHADKSAVSTKQMKNVNQNLLMSMTNFNYGANDTFKKTKTSYFSVKDREGTDFEPQILSQRKFHTKFHTEKEVSGDEKFDVRRYFPRNNIRELYIPESENITKQFKDVEFVDNNNYEERGSGNYRGYRARKGRGGGGRNEFTEKQMYVPKNVQSDQEVMLEDCNMANYSTISLTRDELFQELSKVLEENERKTLQSKVADYYRGRINESVLFDAWIELLGKRLTFKLFPFFIATCENPDTSIRLDEHFYERMLKLPRKNNALIYEFKTYNDFFKSLSFEIEQSIIARVLGDKINYQEKNFMMDASRVFQLIQIIKRLSNADMASFKFAINFGLSPKTKEEVNEILLHEKQEIQEKLTLISEQEIFIILKYLELCKNKLNKTLENISLSKISRNLLEDIFVIAPEIKSIFEKKLGKEEFQKLVEKQYVDTSSKLSLAFKANMPKLPSQKVEEKKEEVKREDIDSGNKFEFPDLKKNKEIVPLPPKKKSKKIGENGKGWEKTTIPYGKNITPEVDIKKRIEEDFPTLAVDKSEEQAKYWSKLTQVQKKTDPIVGDWGSEDKIPLEEEQGETLDDMVVGIVSKKGKKKNAKNTVYLTGGFK